MLEGERSVHCSLLQRAFSTASHLTPERADSYSSTGRDSRISELRVLGQVGCECRTWNVPGREGSGCKRPDLLRSVPFLVNHRPAVLDGPLVTQ